MPRQTSNAKICLYGKGNSQQFPQFPNVDVRQPAGLGNCSLSAAGELGLLLSPKVSWLGSWTGDVGVFEEEEGEEEKGEEEEGMEEEEDGIWGEAACDVGTAWAEV